MLSTRLRICGTKWPYAQTPLESICGFVVVLLCTLLFKSNEWSLGIRVSGGVFLPGHLFLPGTAADADDEVCGAVKMTSSRSVPMLGSALQEIIGQHALMRRASNYGPSVHR